MPSILPKGKTQFFDANGNPLAGGQVYTYVVGTTTPKTTYSDIGGTVSNTNPITLDSSGSAIIWGSGSYRLIVNDSLGNQISDTDVLAPLFVNSNGTLTVSAAATAGEALVQGQSGVELAGLAVTKTASGTIQTVSYASSISLDLTLGNDVLITLTGNATIANPKAMTPGTSGCIYLEQDATGARTVAWGGYFLFSGSTAPTLSTAPNAIDIIPYTVLSSTQILCGFVGGFA